MAAAPTDIRAVKSENRLELDWPDGTRCRIPFRRLRGRCPCAGCVNEFTGERMVDEADVASDVRPVGMSFSGNYALKIAWSDGHDTGLFSWEYLTELCRGEHGESGGAES